MLSIESTGTERAVCSYKILVCNSAFYPQLDHWSKCADLHGMAGK